MLPPVAVANAPAYVFGSGFLAVGLGLPNAAVAPRRAALLVGFWKSVGATLLYEDALDGVLGCPAMGASVALPMVVRKQEGNSRRQKCEGET